LMNEAMADIGGEWVDGLMDVEGRCRAWLGVFPLSFPKLAKRFGNERKLLLDDVLAGQAFCATETVVKGRPSSEREAGDEGDGEPEDGLGKFPDSGE
jgi:hypothetical protein